MVCKVLLCAVLEQLEIARAMDVFRETIGLDPAMAGFGIEAQ